MKLQLVETFFPALLLSFFLLSCASSMTPSEVNDTLPNLTKLTFYNQTQASLAKKNEKCRVLVSDRNYVAPIGFTVKEDLENGAIGIDQWVEEDGGNAYTLVNYKWITVDRNGAIQLHIDFDTMLCEPKP